MGMVATLSRIKADNFELMKENKEYPHKYETASAYVDKLWDIISFAFSGKVGPQQDNISSEIIFPSSNYIIHEDQYMTERVQYSTPQRVKEINQTLAAVSEADFKALIASRTFSFNMLYAELLPDDKEQIFDLLKPSFLALKKLYSDAAINDEYVALAIG